MRELTSHKVNGLNEAIVIEVLDEPGPGNACHEYRLSLDPGKDAPTGSTLRDLGTISFQNGPIQEAGYNGISNEALLAIVEDRLTGFQSGPFACDSNKLALAAVQTAMVILKMRTRERMARGVEGTLAK